ncbi:MAG: VF530 family protein [Crocinitomicaceae bacterium]|nr:VF530 family protein [Crocinitomicaceae bacterium]
MADQPNNPLHGKTLESILTELVEQIGWEQMAYLVPINCFLKDPSIKSSLKFLRRMPWARAKVEKLYIERIYQFLNK